MELGPVTKLNKRNKTVSTKIDYDVMSVNCDVIVVFPIHDQLGNQIGDVIRKPDSGCVVCKTYIFINSSLLYYKN